MGIIRFIIDLFNRGNGTSARKKINNSHKKKKSAIAQGRMRKTDIIKGKHSPIPTEPGIYRHINKKTGKIDYVGQTNNLRVRQQQHARDNKLNIDIQFVEYAIKREHATKNDLCQTEIQHIDKHKPKNNKTKGGNGRR